MTEYVLAGGVQWCTTHYGIIDELGNPAPDGTCDIYDRHEDESCRPTPLYFVDEGDEDEDEDA